MWLGEEFCVIKMAFFLLTLGVWSSYVNKLLKDTYFPIMHVFFQQLKLLQTSTTTTTTTTIAAATTLIQSPLLILQQLLY